MRAKLVPLALLLKASLSFPLELDLRQTTPCRTVQIFIGRGSTEPYPGRQGALATAFCNVIPSCGYSDIIYPATFENYCSSVEAGIASGTSTISSYAARCPFTKIVLTGYSQGAQLIGDILGGGGGEFAGSNCTQATTFGLNPSIPPGNKIAAATLFSDVRHAAYQVYNTGNGSAGAGIYPRAGAQLAFLNSYSSQLRSWCLAGDPVCASGTDINSHLVYFDLFVNEAAGWIKSKL